jgi:manganese transport system ATP-binding protein
LAAGRTVAYTTHDLAEAAEADHVILTAGKVVAEGIAADVLAPDVLAAAYGVGIVHLEDGSIVLDDAAHRPAGRHVHFERGDTRS